jgi:hypothetical protein
VSEMFLKASKNVRDLFVNESFILKWWFCFPTFHPGLKKPWTAYSCLQAIVLILLFHKMTNETETTNTDHWITSETNLPFEMRYYVLEWHKPSMKDEIGHFYFSIRVRVLFKSVLH